VHEIPQVGLCEVLSVYVSPGSPIALNHSLWNFVCTPQHHLNGVLYKSPTHRPCLYVYPPIVARQRLGKHVPAVKNTYNRCIGGVVFYTIRAVSKETMCVWQHIVVTRQRLDKHVPTAIQVVTGAVLYAVCVVSNESRWLVVARSASFAYAQIGIWFSW
jgi:hypothetical protein